MALFGSLQDNDMGIRTGGLDIKSGTRRHAADKAARAEAKAVIDP
jgi:hypothetical protein